MLHETCKGCKVRKPVENLRGCYCCMKFQELRNVPRFEDCYENGRNKLGNEEVEIDGHRFPSKAEGDQYVYLKYRERAGEISNLKLQPKYLLKAKYTDPEGKRRREITYIADFEYIENNQFVTVEVKGHKTKDYVIKAKLFRDHPAYKNYRYEFIKA